MKINDLYSRAETEKQSRRLLAISIIAPTILLIMVVVMAVFTATNAIKSKQTRQLDVLSETAAAGR